MGSTSLGKVISSEFGFIHYKPSVVHFNSSTTDYVESKDGQYIMLVSDRRVFQGDTITLPPNYQYISGMTYNVSSVYEQDGVQYIEVAPAQMTELVTQAEVSTEGKYLAVSEMEIIPGDGVYLFTTLNPDSNKESEPEIKTFSESANKSRMVPFLSDLFSNEYIGDVTTEVVALFDYQYDSLEDELKYDYTLSSIFNIDQPLTKEYLNLTLDMAKGKETEFDVLIGVGGLIEAKLSNNGIPNLGFGEDKLSLNKNVLSIGGESVIISEKALKIGSIEYNFSDTPSIKGNDFEIVFSDSPVIRVGDSSIELSDKPTITQGDNFITFSKNPSFKFGAVGLDLTNNPTVTIGDTVLTLVDGQIELSGNVYGITETVLSLLDDQSIQIAGIEVVVSNNTLSIGDVLIEYLDNSTISVGDMKYIHSKTPTLSIGNLTYTHSDTPSLTVGESVEVVYSDNPKIRLGNVKYTHSDTPKLNIGETEMSVSENTININGLELNMSSNPSLTKNGTGIAVIEQDNTKAVSIQHNDKELLSFVPKDVYDSYKDFTDEYAGIKEKSVQVWNDAKKNLTSAEFRDQLKSFSNYKKAEYQNIIEKYLLNNPIESGEPSQEVKDNKLQYKAEGSAGVTLNGGVLLDLAYDFRNLLSPKIYSNLDVDLETNVDFSTALSVTMPRIEKNIFTLRPSDPVLAALIKVEANLVFKADGTVTTEFNIKSTNKQGVVFDNDGLRHYETVDDYSGNGKVFGEVDIEAGTVITPVLGLNGLITLEAPNEILALGNAKASYETELEKLFISGKLDASVNGQLNLKLLESLRNQYGSVDNLLDYINVEENYSYELYKSLFNLWSAEYDSLEEIKEKEKVNYNTDIFVGNTNISFKDWSGGRTSSWHELTEEEKILKNISSANLYAKNNQIFVNLDLNKLFENKAELGLEKHKGLFQLFNYNRGNGYNVTRNEIFVDQYQIENLVFDVGNSISIENPYKNLGVTDVIGAPKQFNSLVDNQLITGLATKDLIGEHIMYILRKDTVHGEDTLIGDTYTSIDSGEDKVYSKTQHYYYFDQFKITIVDPKNSSGYIELNNTNSEREIEMRHLSSEETVEEQSTHNSDSESQISQDLIPSVQVESEVIVETMALQGESVETEEINLNEAIEEALVNTDEINVSEGIEGNSDVTETVTYEVGTDINQVLDGIEDVPTGVSE